MHYHRTDLEAAFERRLYTASEGASIYGLVTVVFSACPPIKFRHTRLRLPRHSMTALLSEASDNLPASSMTHDNFYYHTVRST